MSEGEEKQGKCQGQIEQLSRLTGELAHEIKNPLSTIKVNLKLITEELENLNNSSGSGEQKFARVLRKMTVVQKEADRVEEILNNFLRYVGKTELQPARTDVNELISDMIDFYSPQAFTNSITVRQGLDKKPLFCNIDSAMFKQVILNLFINALQAMAGGGELIIKSFTEKKYAVIQISDTGTGIEPGKLCNIFEPFHSFKPQGSGLGLAIAKKIIDAHNGFIDVNSELGKGTLFTIKIPLCE